MTETAGSVFALGEYGGVASRLLAICFGAEDLSADLGISPRHPDGSYPAAVVFARAQVLVAAGALGVPAIDTPYPDHSDPEGLRREAAAAEADGFAGKILIHPAQIDIVNAAFTPSPERVRWAETGECRLHRQPGFRGFRAGRQDDRPPALETGAADPGRGGRLNPRTHQGYNALALTSLRRVRRAETQAGGDYRSDGAAMNSSA